MEQSNLGGGSLLSHSPGEDGADAFAPAEADASAFLAALRRRHGGRIVAELATPARPARHADYPPGLDPCLLAALRERGIERPWTHQRECWDHLAAGRHVVVVTPTASGKSLCYHVPVLQSALASGGRALYLFPTKALAQDQVAELLELDAAGRLGVRAMTFDGDTPGDARRAVRDHAQIVVSNPDMLHQAILPHHARWAGFFRGLRHVVIDELHTYRGVFGSHVANVLRRLWRVARFHGASPRFILCSATIANARAHAERILGEPVAAVTESGAPSGARHLLVWNPPLVNAGLGLRASARSQSTGIARAAVRRGLKTIVFANSRLEVEVITRYLKEAFDADPRRPARVAGYRGGYLPTERRRHERCLREGSLDCVVSTSALELGVDIGALDVCVLNGYPGTVAATLQRLGRAGRRQRPAVGVLVCGSDLLDQFLARHPGFLLEASPEHARIDPDQLLVLMDHIRCAAFELPFEPGESFGGLAVGEALEYLREQGVLHAEAGRWHWIAEGYPANAVSLRAIADGNFVVVDVTDGHGTVVAEVDWSAAATTLHEGAIHLIQAAPWQVERLDWTGRKAYARRVDVDYYTDAIDYTRLRVLSCLAQDAHGQGGCGHGEVHVLRRVAGYKKIRYHTHENIGYGPVALPDHEMHTTAVWWGLPSHVLAAHFPGRVEALEGFLGAAWALHAVAALLSLCERRDLGRSVGDGAEGWCATVDGRGRAAAVGLDGNPVDLTDPARAFQPTVHLYDNHPGGIGLSAPLHELRQRVVDEAAAVVAGCGCDHGCPACIGPVLPPAPGSGPGPRALALRVLQLLQGVEPGPVPAVPLRH